MMNSETDLNSQPECKVHVEVAQRDPGLTTKQCQHSLTSDVEMKEAPRSIGDEDIASSSHTLDVPFPEISPTSVRGTSM